MHPWSAYHARKRGQKSEKGLGWGTRWGIGQFFIFTMLFKSMGWVVYSMGSRPTIYSKGLQQCRPFFMTKISTGVTPEKSIKGLPDVWLVSRAFVTLGACLDFVLIYQKKFTD